MTGRQQLAAAMKAIRNNKGMGQFLRELPGSSKMSKEQLQDWAKAYAEARARMSGKVA